MALTTERALGHVAMQPTVVITQRGEDRVRAGHPWIYRSDLVDVQAGAGDTVRLVGSRGRAVGQALFSDRSEIALRVLTRRDEPADLALWQARLHAARTYRQALAIDATAYRLVHAEGDLLPSLIVDRYGDYLVVQALSQGVDRLLPAICEILVQLVAPTGILARNDARVRLLEGLEPRVEVVYGHVPETISVRVGPVEFEVDPWRGQKTGLFLDQRENRDAACRYASGRLLDGFSYTGGFALRLAPQCAEVLAVDISEEAVAQITANAARHRFPHVHARVANLFDALRDLERSGERFETIVLDPPAFARNRASVARAVAGYKEINLRALKLLRPGGYLITCSCSYHVDEARFGQIVHEAALDARASLVIVEKRLQARDHPVLLGVPETSYLKCFIVRKLS